MTASISRSIVGDLLDGVANLFIGWLLQIGRACQLFGLKLKRAAIRRHQRRAALALGRAMADAGSGDAYLRQRIETLRKTGPAAELDEEQVKLGISGLQASVPPLNIEANYHDAHCTYQEAVAIEQHHDAVAGRIWPQGPVGWLGLIAGYFVAAAALLLVLVFTVPQYMPPVLVALVRSPSATHADELPRTVIHGVHVAVTDATIDRGFETVYPTTNRLPTRADAVMLQVTIELVNRTDKPVRFVTWRGHRDFRNTAAYIRDDKGRAVDPYVSAPHQMPAGAVYNVMVPPNGKVQDVLHFGRPDEQFEYLELFLPCVNLDPADPDLDIKRLRLDRLAVNKPGDPVKRY
jgi:hypothetical protein